MEKLNGHSNDGLSLAFQRLTNSVLEHMQGINEDPSLPCPDTLENLTAMFPAQPGDKDRLEQHDDPDPKQG